MDKSKMKEIRRQVRSADLSNKKEEVERSKHYYDTERNKENDANQLNKVSDLVEELRLHANPSDLAEQSTQPHTIGPDGVEHNKERLMAFELGKEKDIKSPTTDDIIAYNRKQDKQKVEKEKREVLNELWDADCIIKDGYWYVKLTDAIKIINTKGNDNV